VTLQPSLFELMTESDKNHDQ